MPRIEPSIESKLMDEAVGHPRTCICAGCFYYWLSRQEARAWLDGYLNDLYQMQKASEERQDRVRRGLEPPDDRIIGSRAQQLGEIISALGHSTRARLEKIKKIRAEPFKIAEYFLNQRH